ncbi:MAG: hypothetical protein V1913_10615 [Fibrobacterota bacterium]
MKKNLVLAVLVALACALHAEKLLVLPMAGDLAKLEDYQTINLLFRESIQQAFGAEVTTTADSQYRCESVECATGAAKALGADKVVYSTARKLGAKWLLTATVIKADGSDLFNQRGTALGVEDFEPLTARLAKALKERKTMDQAADVENITQQEETNEPTKRKGAYTGGLIFGYIYPIGKSFAYLNNRYGLSLNSDSMTLREYSQLIKIGWVNSWELKSNLALNLEFVWHVPIAFGGDINVQYLTNKSDFTPFFGGGLGLHYVKADADEDVYKDKRNSGPALNGQAGLILFRTYNIHVVLRGQYMVIFNTDMDHGPSWDMSLVYQQKQRNTEETGANSGSSFWKYVLLLGVVGLIGAAASN